MPDQESGFFAELKRRNVFRVGAAYLVVGWLVAQVADVALDNFGTPPWVIQTILLVLLLGFPVALLLAWAFELTPDGIKLENQVDRSRSVTSQTGRRLDIATLIGVAIVGILVVGDRLWPDAAQPNLQTAASGEARPAQTSADDSAISAYSVAVLPFANRSPLAEDAFFADGIHDDLLTQLSKISVLEVISRTSVGRYRDTEKPIPEIAAELGVAVVLEGAVQRAGQRVRINVQLIDGLSDKHLWAENYDRELSTDNLFEIQAEITRGIAAALKTVLTGSDQAAMADAPTASVAAYDAYIQGNLMSAYNKSDYQKASESYDQAIALDPQFGIAYAGKARAQLSLYWYSTLAEKYRDAARVALDEAQRLAPDAVETLIALGYYHYWGFLDYATADGYLERAQQLAPNNSEVYLARAFVARRDGRFDAAVAALERARRLDPLKFETTLELMDTNSRLGRWKDAQRYFVQTQSFSTGAANFADNAASYFERIGDLSAAWKIFTDGLEGDAANFHNTRAYIAWETRDPDKMSLALDKWPEKLRRPLNNEEAFELARARILLALGKTADAEEVLLGISARLADRSDPYPAGWAHNALYTPLTLPALQRDLDGINEAVRTYRQDAPRDAMSAIDLLHNMAAAYAAAGDPESALDFMQENQRGRPWLFARCTLNPDLDSLRQHPRYVDLQQAFERWRAANP